MRFNSYRKEIFKLLYINQASKERSKIIFVFKFHSTKESNFQGKQDLAFNVELIIEIQNGNAMASGRFGERMGIFDW